jgi:hypothetical protein
MCNATCSTSWKSVLPETSEYLNREQAYLDAIEAATEARQTGQEAEVWDRSTNTRVF